ncbi:MAG: hypothetical protein ACR2M4_12465 [Actinomycetota bacterium]
MSEIEVLESSLVTLDSSADGSLIRPAGSLEQIVNVFEEYQKLTKRLLTDDDYQTIGSKRFPKRSAWRKLATAFGVSFEIVEHTITREGRDVKYAEFTTRAKAPNGRMVEGWGACDAYERCCTNPCTNRRDYHKHCPAAKGETCPGGVHFSHPNHDIPATAETRSKNRAAADLFGLGQVSAEEVIGDGEEPKPITQADRAVAKHQPKPVTGHEQVKETGPTDAQAGLMTRLAQELGHDVPDLTGVERNEVSELISVWMAEKKAAAQYAAPRAK